MKKLIAGACATFAFISCVDYQLSPYAELQIRDEEFSPPGGASEYGGETFMVGVRYVPPTRISALPPFGVPSLVAPREPVDIDVNIPKDEPEDSLVDDLANAGKDEEGNWTMWGVCALLAIGLVWREIKRPTKEAT